MEIGKFGYGCCKSGVVGESRVEELSSGVGGRRR